MQNVRGSPMAREMGMKRAVDIAYLCYARKSAGKNCHDCTEYGHECDRTKQVLKVKFPFEHICSKIKK